MTDKKQSFLSKLGHGLLNLFHVAAPAFPLLAGGLVGPQIGGIFSIVLTVERAYSGFQAASPGQKFGPDKLQAALPLVKDLLMATDQFAGKNIIDPQGFTDGCTTLINGAVAVLNAVQHPDGK